MSLWLLSLSACTPALSPLYRDYEVRADDTPVTERIEAALDETGWQRIPGSAPNVVATQERRVRQWGLYSVMVSLEVVPVGNDHVRLYVHPYRKYFTGNRSKIPYLKRGLRRTVLQDLNDAFDDHGLTAIGTAIQRDREAEAR